MNGALRTFEVDIILKMGFFIQDIYKQIDQLHSEQSADHQIPLVVYRGQRLSKTDFEKLMKTRGGLMSFNNFLSTSKNRNISLNNFARPALTDPNSIGILFTMDIDRTVSSASFARLDNVSYFRDSEQEILFSMHTVFRIGKIEQIDENDRLWEVKLSLTSDDDEQLRALTARIREETFDGSEGWHRLAILLNKLHKFDEAEEICTMLLDQEFDNSNRGHLYNVLGEANIGQRNPIAAFSCLRKALEITPKTVPSNQQILGKSYMLMGVVQNSIGDYSKAFSLYEEAAEVLQNALPPDDRNLALCYMHIGNVYLNIFDHSTAILFYEKAIQIREKILTPNHPDLAISYNNIGNVYSQTGVFSKALESHKKALEIFQKTLPSNHPNLVRSYANIGIVYISMRNYPDALPYCERAVEIAQKALSPYHDDRQTYENKLESVKRQLRRTCVDS